MNQTYDRFGYTRAILNHIKYGCLFEDPQREKPFTDFEYEDWVYTVLKILYFSA